MPITDSQTDRETTCSVDEMEYKARRMRAYILTAITCAQSGHPGGSLSATEIMAALYLDEMKHDPQNTIKTAVDETGILLTVEEHQVGGFGNIIAGAAARLKDKDSPLKMDMVGVQDRFGESGDAWLLIRHFGLSAEWIASRALSLM